MTPPGESIVGKGPAMIDLTPFLLFDGNCSEAMEFYRSCFGGELTITKVAEVPMPHEPPPELLQKVAYGRLKNGAVDISGTDWQHPTRKFRQGNTVALYVTGRSHEELREIFERLAAGGDPDLRDDLRELAFGIYGHLADRYGVHWFFRGDAHS